MIPFKHIIVSGTPYNIGLEFGQQAKEYIDASINTYRDMFRDYSGIEWEKAKKYALTFIPVIEKYDADIMEEIKGIAEGSGYELSEILALNVRSEIVLQAGQIDAVIDGCTSCAVMPYKAADGHTLIAQNWDWKGVAHASLVIEEIHQIDKPDIIMITEAGIVGQKGFNSCGVGVCMNALASDRQPEGVAIPLHIALRGVLNSRTFSDAIRESGKMPLACCSNFLVGCGKNAAVSGSSGQVGSLEIGPDGIDFLYPASGIGYVTHTNHFYGPRMARIHDTGCMSFPDTFLRQGRIQDMFYQKGSGLISSEDIMSMLRDHVGYPDSICRHDDALEEPGKRIRTNYSIIMDLDEKFMWYTPEAPCGCEYIKVVPNFTK